MNITATLIVQMITFSLFVWFTMTFVWPLITAALDERRQKIADGLAAAERGQHELMLATEKATQKLRDAKHTSAEIVENANKRAHNIVDEAKAAARIEGEKLIERANSEIELQANNAKAALMQQVSQLAIAGAERILSKEVDAKTHKAMLDALIKEI